MATRSKNGMRKEKNREIYTHKHARAIEWTCLCNVTSKKRTIQFLPLFPFMPEDYTRCQVASIKNTTNIPERCRDREREREKRWKKKEWKREIVDKYYMQILSETQTLKMYTETKHKSKTSKWVSERKRGKSVWACLSGVGCCMHIVKQTYRK